MSSLIFPHLKKYDPVKLEKFIESIKYTTGITSLDSGNFNQTDFHLTSVLLDNLKYTPELKNFALIIHLRAQTCLFDSEKIRESFEFIPKLEKLSFGGFDEFLIPFGNNIHLLCNLRYLHLDMSRHVKQVDGEFFTLLNKNTNLKYLSLTAANFAPGVTLPMMNGIEELILYNCDQQDLTLFRYFPDLKKLVMNRSSFWYINGVRIPYILRELNNGGKLYDIAGEVESASEKLIDIQIIDRKCSNLPNIDIVYYLLFHFPNLQKFTLDSIDYIDPSSFSQIVPELEELDIRLPSGNIHLNQTINSFKRLRKFSISCKYTEIEGKNLEENLIEELSLTGAVITDFSIMMNRLPHLRKINLDGVSVAERCVTTGGYYSATEKYLVEIFNGLELIEEFRIIRCYGLDREMDQIINHFNRMSNLKVFECDFNAPLVINKDMDKVEVLKFKRWTNINQLSYFPNLKELTLEIINGQELVDLINHLHFVPGLKKLELNNFFDRRTLDGNLRAMHQILDVKLEVKYYPFSDADFIQSHPLNIDTLLEKIPNIEKLIFPECVVITFTKLHLCPKLSKFNFTWSNHAENEDISTADNMFIANSYNEITWNPRIHEYKNWYIRHRVETFINSNTVTNPGENPFLPIGLENEILYHLGTLYSDDPVIIPEV